MDAGQSKSFAAFRLEVKATHLLSELVLSKEPAVTPCFPLVNSAMPRNHTQKPFFSPQTTYYSTSQLQHTSPRERAGRLQVRQGSGIDWRRVRPCHNDDGEDSR
jgi:hypothetical protein